MCLYFRFPYCLLQTEPERKSYEPTVEKTMEFCLADLLGFRSYGPPKVKKSPTPAPWKKKDWKVFFFDQKILKQILKKW